MAHTMWYYDWSKDTSGKTEDLWLQITKVSNMAATDGTYPKQNILRLPPEEQKKLFSILKDKLE